MHMLGVKRTVGGLLSSKFMNSLNGKKVFIFQAPEMIEARLAPEPVSLFPSLFLLEV